MALHGMQRGFAMRSPILLKGIGCCVPNSRVLVVREEPCGYRWHLLVHPLELALIP